MKVPVHVPAYPPGSANPHRPEHTEEADIAQDGAAVTPAVMAEGTQRNHFGNPVPGVRFYPLGDATAADHIWVPLSLVPHLIPWCKALIAAENPGG